MLLHEYHPDYYYRMFYSQKTTQALVQTFLSLFAFSLFYGGYMVVQIGLWWSTETQMGDKLKEKPTQSGLVNFWATTSCCSPKSPIAAHFELG